ELVPSTYYEVLSAKLAEKPYNPDSWKRLIVLAKESHDIKRIQTSFESLLDHYPNAKAYLKWKESDLELAKNGKYATLMSYIQHVYNKAFIYMWHHHEIWLMASEWLDKVGEYDRALTILDMGIKATNRYVDLH
ncbi:hypothetical protein J132_10853, partial [Termitomyces sp. J132]